MLHCDFELKQILGNGIMSPLSGLKRNLAHFQIHFKSTNIRNYLKWSTLTNFALTFISIEFLLFPFIKLNFIKAYFTP